MWGPLLLPVFPLRLVLSGCDSFLSKKKKRVAGLKESTGLSCNLQLTAAIHVLSLIQCCDLVITSLRFKAPPMIVFFFNSIMAHNIQYRS